MITLNSVNTFIKQGTIAVASGCLHWFSSTYIFAPVCRSSTSDLSNYLCLNSAKFLDPRKLTPFFNPIVKLSNLVERIIEPINPNFFKIQTCDLITQNLGFIINDFPIQLRNLVMEKSAWCCTMVPHYAEKIVADALREELVYRVCLQKIALIFIAKFFPKRVEKFLAHPTFRILIASSIFSLAHRGTNSVLPQFMAGLMLGSLFEKYGLWASVISHSASNFCHLLTWKNYCDSNLLPFINQAVSEKHAKVLLN